MKHIPGISLHPRRKVRADARLSHLNAEQRERLHVWLDDENRTYATVVVLLRTEFGLTTSKSALSVYYQRHILPEYADDTAEIAAVLAALKAGNFAPIVIYRAKALAFSALVRPDPQIHTADKLLKLVHRAAMQDIARQRLALKQQRATLRATELAARQSRSSLPTPASQKIASTPPRFPAYATLSQSPEVPRHEPPTTHHPAQQAPNSSPASATALSHSEHSLPLRSASALSASSCSLPLTKNTTPLPTISSLFPAIPASIPATEPPPLLPESPPAFPRLVLGLPPVKTELETPKPAAPTPAHPHSPHFTRSTPSTPALTISIPASLRTPPPIHRPPQKSARPPPRFPAYATLDPPALRFLRSPLFTPCCQPPRDRLTFPRSLKLPVPTPRPSPP